MENVSVVFDNNGMPGKVICHGEEFNVADAVFCGKMEELGAYAYKIRLCITDSSSKNYNVVSDLQRFPD